MTVKDAAERLNLALPTVYDLIRVGMIPARRLGVKGRKIWLDPEDVEAYWEQSKVRNPSQTSTQTSGRLVFRPGG